MNYSNSDEQPITISTFECQADNHPVMTAMHFADLGEMMETHEIRAKKDGLAFSGAEYAPGQLRSNANVLQLNLIIIDVDGGNKDAMWVFRSIVTADSGLS